MHLKTHARARQNGCVDDEQDQRTVTIGGAADALGVSPHWLRLSERLGSIPRAARDEDGWRRYSPKDVERLRRLGVGARKRRLAGMR